MEMITSVQNPKVKQLLLLQQKSSERKKTGLFVVEGRRELMHCLEADYELDTVFVCSQLETGVEPMPTLPSGVRLLEVSKAVYEKIAYRGSTEGVVAVVRSRQLRLSDLALGPHPLIVVVVSGFSCLFEKTPHFDTKMEETDTKSIFFQQNACTIEKKAVSLQSNSAKAGFLHSPDRVE